eukprot:gene4371-8704_t
MKKLSFGLYSLVLIIALSTGYAFQRNYNPSRFKLPVANIDRYKYNDLLSFTSSFSKQIKSLCFLAIIPALVAMRPLDSAAVESLYRKSTSGVEYYDYVIGDGISPAYRDKVVFHYKGRLAGRQGWIYDDTRAADLPVRMTLGVSPCIEGLEKGLVGEGDSMPPMRVGGLRRLVIPASLGYKGKEQLPIPSDFSQKQRLYSTVLNPIRGDREREALGDSLAGIVVMDVDLIRVHDL